MSDVIGRGVIEVVADARKFKAGMDDAKKAIKDLGASQTGTSAAASRSIDNYVQRLQLQAATIGKSARETEIFKLAARGATDAQIASAAAALRLTEAHKQSARTVGQLKTGMLAIGVAAGVGLIAAAAAFDHLVKQAGDFQDMGEKIGDTAENLASLAVSAAVGGMAMDAVVGASAKLTKGLTGVDDESKAAGAAISALGLDLKTFKQLAPADQFETIAKALAGFEDGTQKTAVAMALFGKAGAEMLPFLKELGREGGRQTILTKEQIALADEYSDRQKALRTQMSLYASAIFAEMLPAYNDLTGAFLDVIKGIAGVDSGAKGLKNSTAIQDFAESASKSLAFLVDSGDGVVRVYQLITTAIGGVVAADQLMRNALAHPFSGAFGDLKNLPATIRAEMDAILMRPTFGSILNARIAARKAGGAADEEPKKRKKLDFDGAIKAAKDGKDTAEQEAKSQLAFDIDQIKKMSDVSLNVFSNAEKVMMAMRAAGLVDERDYYSHKLTFLNVNSAEQEEALQKEITRLQQENLIGKDRIDNDRKIADAQLKLAKVRADAVANVQINSIQETAALKAVEQGYRDAENAAQEYLDTIKRTQARDLAGMGAGSLERSRAGGRAQIEDKYSEEMRALNSNRIKSEFAGTFGHEAKKKYDDELDRIRRFKTLALSEFDTYFAERKRKESDWYDGATEAMANYYTESRNVAKQTEDLFTNAFKNMEDALVEFVKTGKLDFKSLVDSVITDLIRIQVRKAMGDAVAAATDGGWVAAIGKLVGLGGGGSASAPASSYMGGAIGNDGNAYGALLGSFATGTDYVPRTGLYQLHQGETVTPADRASSTVTVTNIFQITGQTDSRSQAQISAAAGEGVKRAMARNN